MSLTEKKSDEKKPEHPKKAEHSEKSEPKKVEQGDTPEEVVKHMEEEEMKEEGKGSYQSEQAKVDHKFAIDPTAEAMRLQKVARELNKGVTDYRTPKAGGMSATSLKQGDLPEDRTEDEEPAKDLYKRASKSA